MRSAGSGAVERVDATIREPAASRLAVTLAALASAACFVASLPALSWWWMMPVSLALFAWSAVAGRCRRALLLSTAVAWLGAWTWIQWWIVDVSEAGMPAFVVYLAIWPIVAAFVLRRLATRGPTRRWPLAALLPVVWIGMEFLRAEIVFHGYPWYLAGHPMIEAPILAQSADLFGVSFVGTIVALVAGAMADVALGSRRGAARLSLRATRLAVAAAVVAIGANLGYGAWRLAQAHDLPAGPIVLAVQTNLPVSNKNAWAPDAQVRDFRTFGRQTIDAFRAALDAGVAPDLVAWPETMVPGFGFEPEALATLVDGGFAPGDYFARGIEQLATILRRPVVVGSPSFMGLHGVDGRWRWDRHFNSAYLVEPRPAQDGEATLDDRAAEGDAADGGDPTETDPAAGRFVRRQRYDKLVLTPFGETMPYISAWPWLQERLLALGANGMTFDLDVGDRIVRLHASVPGADDGAPDDHRARAGERAAPPRRFTIATPICFEDTVAWLCRRMVHGSPDDGSGSHSDGSTDGKRIDAFVNLSNDGWFGSNDSGRLQHAQIARYRTIENRVPMVRVVNTGVSVSIDSCGRLVGAVDETGRGYGRPGIAGTVLARTQRDPRTTLYGRIGEVWGAGIFAFLVVLVGAGLRRGVAAGPDAP
ncbi:MAG: hypothetical protein U0575_04515 [Phycisphaerales bacterium]